MFRAVKKAASAGLFVASTRADGLRAIRFFEQVNDFPFDPFDQWHVRTVTNMGWHFSLDRKLSRLRGSA